MEDFNYVKYTKNNPLLKEAFGGDALSNYLKAASQRCFNGGGNGQNLLDNASELASFLDAYDISYARGGAEEPGFYTPGTAVAFKKLIDSMVDDEIENNNMSKYGAGNDDDNYDEFTDNVNNIKEAYSFNIKGDRIKGSGDFNPDVEVMSHSDGVKLSQKINNRNSIILLSNKQAKELKNNL